MYIKVISENFQKYNYSLNAEIMKMLNNYENHLDRDDIEYFLKGQT